MYRLTLTDTHTSCLGSLRMTADHKEHHTEGREAWEVLWSHINLAPATKSWPSYTWSVRRVRNGLIQTQDHCSIHLLCQALLCCPGFCLPHSSYTKGTHVANMISSGFYLLCIDFCILPHLPPPARLQVPWRQEIRLLPLFIQHLPQCTSVSRWKIISWITS